MKRLLKNSKICKKTGKYAKSTANAKKIGETPCGFSGSVLYLSGDKCGADLGFRAARADRAEFSVKQEISVKD